MKNQTQVRGKSKRTAKPGQAKGDFGTIRVPFNDAELAAIDRACAGLGIDRNTLLTKAVEKELALAEEPARAELNGVAESRKMGTTPRRARRTPYVPPEIKLIRVGESAPEMIKCDDDPAACVDYWKNHVATAAWFDAERESCIVLLMNTRFKITDFHLVSGRDTA